MLEVGGNRDTKGGGFEVLGVNSPGEGGKEVKKHMKEGAQCDQCDTLRGSARMNGSNIVWFGDSTTEGNTGTAGCTG